MSYFSTEHWSHITELVDESEPTIVTYASESPSLMTIYEQEVAIRREITADDTLISLDIWDSDNSKTENSKGRNVCKCIIL